MGCGCEGNLLTTTNALARRTLTDSDIRQLIELRKEGNFGFERLNPAVLNSVYLLCRDLDLVPGDEVIGYQGAPYINVHGTLTLARRHPEYRGFSQRPLSLEEKELWGFEPEDLVVESTIRTATWGDITQLGKVSADEVALARARAKANDKRVEPVGSSPVEIACKRSLMRAARAAFGRDAIPDEGRMEIEVKRVNTRGQAEQYAALDKAFAGEVAVEHISQEEVAQT